MLFIFNYDGSIFESRGGYVMKILCTGDLHIGKIVNQFSMIEEQRYILDQITSQLIETEAEILIIAGDLYDRSVPNPEAVTLLDNFLFKVINELSRKVLIISGNHDSNERLNFASRFLKDKGLYIQTSLENCKITINDVNFFLFPYMHPRAINNPDLEIKSYQDAVDYMIDSVHIDETETNICIYHGLVLGGKEVTESDSERTISIGTMDDIDVTTFNVFDYTILGHLHQNQVISNYAEYTGSPLKYSFSEVNHNKSTTLLTINDKEIEREKLLLTSFHDFRVVTGFFDDLMKEEYSEDYIKIVLKDKGEVYEPVNRLRTIFPNIMLLEREMFSLEKPVSFGKKQRESITSMFSDFYQEISGEELTDTEKEFVASIEEDII